MRITVDVNFVDAGWEESAHPRGPGGQFGKAHAAAEKKGFVYKGTDEKNRHVWHHANGQRLTLHRGGIGRATGSHVATLHMGKDQSRSESDPVWPENAVRRVFRKAGV